MLKLLIVDDSVFSQKVIVNSLKKYLPSVEMIFAKDGKEGLQTYKEQKPDYVFLDLLMPEISGQEVARLIKEFDEDAKIIVVSADVQKNIREEMEAYGIITFVNKPFTEEKAQFISNLILEMENE